MSRPPPQSSDPHSHPTHAPLPQEWSFDRPKGEQLQEALEELLGDGHRPPNVAGAGAILPRALVAIPRVTVTYGLVMNTEEAP